ncbi:MAG TPA: FtsQ-type POTRA domain-containing protein [Solirubrobacteraceae bacterium]|jgi:cell division protein FtsQ|nr:FtsQ-type POTRA domain-containing protein [Solirubrobacteraceae bacterium]
MLSFASRRLRVVVGVAAVLAMGGVGLWLRASSLVRVQQVTVTGIEGRQAGEIRDALAVAGLGMTTLAVDQDELRDAVSTYPVVRSLRTSVDLPHRLRIEVNAYDAVAALAPRRGSPTAVAADGTVLRGSSTQGLPLVGVRRLPGGDHLGDVQALRAISLLGIAPAPLRRRVARVFRGSRGFAATVHDGPKLYFGGSERLRAKWAAAALVLANPSSQGASYVDVRIPERPVAGGFQPRPIDLSTSTLG